VPAPLVSVIMNGHNAAPYLRGAIASVTAQTYPQWEIIFWDNQSTDETQAIVGDFNDPRLRYFLAPTFTPLGEARNLAIREARGEFIAFLDCDDVWLPDKLERQVPLFTDPEVGLVYSDTIFFNARGDEKRAYGGVLPGRGHCFRQLLGRYFLSMETVVLRRSALESRTEWFDRRFNMIEEADLFRRIAHDWKIDGVADALARWRVHASSWTFRHPELFREETLLMLERYRQLYPDFDAEYAHEIAVLMDVVALSEARDAWLKGNKWPLVQHFLSRPQFSARALALAVMFWPASRAALALRLRGDVLPDELLTSRNRVPFSSPISA
jgi:glycosyltransferase involved in cell wall biosynthesis